MGEVAVAREGGILPINAVSRGRRDLSNKGIESLTKGDFTPKTVFGHELTAGDKVGLQALRSLLTGGKDEWDVNMTQLNKVLSERGKETEVNVKDIYPTQNYLSQERTAQYMNNPKANFSDRGLGVTGYRLPNGKVILDDGHHRVAAQILKGASVVKVKVIDVGEYNSKRFFKSLSKKK